MRTPYLTLSFPLFLLSCSTADSSLYTNSPAWYGVQQKEDVARLSPERQQWVAAALRSAAFLVSSVANKRLEQGSEYGNHNFHVGIVATARYLIRMCELLPDVCDRYEISLDIDCLLLKLPYHPVAPFVDGLRRTLAKAREQGILPYTQMSSAAAKRPISSPPILGEIVQLPGLNPFPWHDPVQISEPFGEIPTQTMPSVPNVPRADSVAWADEFDLAAWFPSTSELSRGVEGLKEEEADALQTTRLPHPSLLTLPLSTSTWPTGSLLPRMFGLRTHCRLLHILSIGMHCSEPHPQRHDSL